jgi:uncharacterized NAD-dependent epimerase/dehydratase family protein
MPLENIDEARVAFSTLSGRGIRVAVVDTGIDPTHPNVGAVSAGVRLSLGPGSGVVRNEDFRDDFGHGTAAAAIVRKVAPGAELLAVKISAGTDAVPPELLAEGIAWSVENGADVINVSAGTSSPEAIEEVCRQALDAGVVVVAAESNDDGPTYPAALDSVLAVGGAALERQVHAYHCDPSLHRRFLAYGGFQKVAWTEPRFLFMSGNSLAAPRISGIVALILEAKGRMPRARLMELLRYNSANGSSAASTALTDESLPYPAPRAIDWIQRAAIYPFSKEMQSLVRFRHLLPFELVGVADAPARGLVGKDAGTALGLPPTGLTITARLEEALAKADTLIVGFTHRLGELHRRDVQGELVSQALRLNKNVYCFETLALPGAGGLTLEAARRGLRLAWPGVDGVDLDELRRTAGPPGNYARTPILGIVGTSSAQGKFTLQLLLRAELRARGLEVGQVGTEHQSRLFGMDDSFAMGFVNNVHLDPKQWGEYFDLRYRQIVRDRRPDIILFGTQGGTIPYEAPQPGDAGFADANLLLLGAARADSYILVVNHLDEFSFIRDTIDVLRLVGRGRTIMLALSTRRRTFAQSFGRTRITAQDVEPGEQAEHLRRLEDFFGLPAFSILDPAGPERLVDEVVRAYSAGRRAAESCV